MKLEQKSRYRDLRFLMSYFVAVSSDSVVHNTFSKKFDLECLVEKSRTYWLQPCLPDPNILFAGAKHWNVINSIVPSYDRFLQISNAINRTLKAQFEVNFRVVDFLQIGSQF